MKNYRQVSAGSWRSEVISAFTGIFPVRFFADAEGGDRNAQ